MSYNGPLPQAIKAGGTAVSSVTTSPTATSFAGWDGNKNLSANSLIAGYRTLATAGGTTTLTVASAESQFFTGSLNQTVVLPVTSTLALGQQFYIYNNSTGTVTVNSSGGNLVSALAAGSWGIFTCILTSGTSAASWSNVTASTTPGIHNITNDNGFPVSGSTIQLQTGGLSVAGATFFVTGSGATLTIKNSDIYDNIAFGRLAGGPLISGGNAAYNVGIGNVALGSVNSNQFCVAIGLGALSGDTSGQGNTAIGAQTLYELNGGSNNVIVGYNSGVGYTSTESNNIIIGANILGGTSESNAIRIGGGSSSCYISGISGATPVGANIPQVVLCDNAGGLTVINSSTAGYVLTSNGASTPSFQAPVSGITNVNQTSSSATLAANSRYLTNNGASLVTYTIPAGAAVGDTYIIVGGSSGGWTIAQPASVTCHITGSATTAGVGGSISSTNQYDCITISCVASNTFTGYAIQSAGLTVV